VLVETNKDVIARKSLFLKIHFYLSIGGEDGVKWDGIGTLYNMR